MVLWIEVCLDGVDFGEGKFLRGGGGVGSFLFKPGESFWERGGGGGSVVCFFWGLRGGFGVVGGGGGGGFFGGGGFGGGGFLGGGGGIWRFLC